MGIVCDEKKKKIIRENMQLSHSVSISYEDLRHIESQKKTCVFKITTDSINGTGFFGLIRFPNQKMIKALFTCHHNLVSENSKEIQKSFQYSIGINEKFIKMEINDSRFVYQNKEYDIVIIEILESDKIEINSFLEIDDLIYEEDKKYEEFVLIINKKDDRDDIIKNILHLKEMKISIYLLHYPKFESLDYSTGVMTKLSANYELNHTCASEHGSSGGPIISLGSHRIFGIHLGRIQNKNKNAGTAIRGSINEFIQQYQKSKRNNCLTKEDYNSLKEKFDSENHNYLENSIQSSISDNYINNNDSSNTITLIYQVPHDSKKLMIFHRDFVKSNKNIQMIIKGISMNICHEIDLDLFSKDEDILVVQLKGINKIKTIFKMFCQCNNFLSSPDIGKWDTSNIRDMRGLFLECKELKEIPDISNWNTENVIDMGEMFELCISLKSLPDISKWNISNVENLGNMFKSCSNLQSLPDISKWKTDKVINIREMFRGCNNLLEIPDISKWNISNVKEMNYLFCNCINLLSLPDISKWNINNVLKMDYLFGFLLKIRKIPDISNWKTNNTFDIQSLFINCPLIESLPDISKWNTSKVIDMNAMFAGCKNLKSLPDISNWDTSNVTDMAEMFGGLSSIKSLPDISKWNTKSVKTTKRMFSLCISLTSFPDISKWDISKVSDLSFMFSFCESLQELPDLSTWNTKNVINISGMFLGCSSLKSLPKIEKSDFDNLKDYKMMFENRNQNLQIPRVFLDNNFNFMNNQIKSISMDGEINDESLIQFGNLNLINNHNPFPFNNGIIYSNMNQFPGMLPNIINTNYFGNVMNLYNDIY